MKIPDLIASLKEGSGSKLTPDERKEIMQKLLEAQDQSEEVVLEAPKLDAQIATSTKGLFKVDGTVSQTPEDSADAAQLPGNVSGWLGKLRSSFRGSKPASMQTGVDNSGASGTGPSIRKSIAENKTIIYLVVVGVLVFLGWQGVNYFLNSGHQQIDNKSTVAKVKAGKSRAAVRKTKSKPAVAKTTSKNDSLNLTQSLSKTSIQTALQDCTIAATIRTALKRSLENTKKSDPRDYTLAVLALQSFQKKYQASDVIVRIETSNTKSTMARRLLSPEMQILRTQINQYREVRTNMQKELTELREQERKSQDGRRLQNRIVAGVNQGIRLRNEIDLIEAHLRDAPKEEDLLMVKDQISILESILSGVGGDDAETTNNSVSTAQGVTTLTSLDPDQLQQKLNLMIKSDFSPITAAVAKNNPDLKRYQIQNATKTLSQFVGMLTVLKSMPDNILGALDREQLRINNKLDRLLGNSSGNWLDYAPCLKGKSG